MLRRLVLDKIAIGVTASHVPIHIRADESALSQIVLNLVVNARDAMPDGGTATIELGIARLEDPVAPRLGIASGQYAGISVRDTGQGIPPEVQRHLFEPFFTTKPPEQGTGLGLSIVYGIVTGLGGAIEVQSEIGRGATFTIYLPLVDART
jgi:two-component system, cell cycle sensor histidine kinase and response regulator CckA